MSEEDLTTTEDAIDLDLEEFGGWIFRRAV